MYLFSVGRKNFPEIIIFWKNKNNADCKQKKTNGSEQSQINKDFNGLFLSSHSLKKSAQNEDKTYLKNKKKNGRDKK